MAKIVIAIDTGSEEVADIVESFHLAYASSAKTPDQKEAFFHNKVVEYIGEVHHAMKVQVAKQQIELATPKAVLAVDAVVK